MIYTPVRPALFAMALTCLTSCQQHPHEEALCTTGEIPHFDEREHASLYKLVSALDAVVLARQAHLYDYNESYSQYLEQCVVSDMQVFIDDLSDSTHSRLLRESIQGLKQIQLFDEIWNYRILQKPFSQDSLREYALNLEGKYVPCLSKLSQDHALLGEYFEAIVASAEISPGANALILKSKKGALDFDQKGIRLVVAVHLLTVASQLDAHLIANMED